MIYHQTISIDAQTLEFYDNALKHRIDLGTRPGNVDFLKIVIFPDHHLADVRVINTKEDGCYCEMALFDRNGSELAYTEIHNALSGVFEITWKDNTYQVDVCAA